jgi:nicotinamide phosphoribosyltransferase
MKGIDNPILDVDSYKASHYLQYPPGTTHIYSYIESRGGRYAQTVFFGLQYLLKRYLTGPVVTAEMVAEARDFFALHGEPFNEEGWMRIVRIHGGRLPVRIRAVPEGTVVKTHNVLASVENTDPEMPWLTSWLETMLMRIWYPTTVATRSWSIRGMILNALERSADEPEKEIAFKLHDFGSRGVSSRESAALGGAAHLVNFLGSDTVVGVLLANQYYGCDMAGYSIPAAEHSTITAWGREHEVDAHRNMLRQFARPGSVVACVSDSYDIFNAVEHLWGEELRSEVIDSGATVVIRPDSGDPASIVLTCLELLEKGFGSVVNAKGYRVLNNVRVIQGDGINERSIGDILALVLANGFSASNVNFGMGGGLLQQLNRDTQKFAMKASHGVINGHDVDIFKDPVTDHGKRSKTGRLDLVRDESGELVTLQESTARGRGLASELVTVFENGEVLAESTFEEIRARARQVTAEAAAS